MERAGGVIDTVARVIKMMDRSNLSLLNAIDDFEGWNMAGAILSVPMLAIAKIVCDRVRPLAALGHFLEG